MNEAKPKFIKICGAKTLIEEVYTSHPSGSSFQIHGSASLAGLNIHSAAFYPNSGLMIGSGSSIHALPNYIINTGSISFMKNNGQVTHQNNTNPYFQPIQSVTVKLGP